VQSWKNPVRSLYEATKNELQGSGMTIFKSSTRVFKIIVFEMIVCSPTLTLKFKKLMLKL
jgi:hypothetical protein